MAKTEPVVQRITYRVVARRTAVYEVQATSCQEAIDKMIDGQGEEVDGSTEQIEGMALCPDCESVLTDATTRTVTDAEGEESEEPTYCDACDREVIAE